MSVWRQKGELTLSSQNNQKKNKQKKKHILDTQANNTVRQPLPVMGLKVS